jgi:uncharacterized membrane protein YccC
MRTIAGIDLAGPELWRRADQSHQTPNEPMSHKSLRAIAFVVRCSVAATAASELASSLGLPEAVWAAMSALIVSLDRLHETRSSLTWRILGTLLGIAVSIAVSEAGSRVAAACVVQMAAAVAICALVAQQFPKLRVAMWTCPILLLPAHPGTPIVAVALGRGGEVICGALVGGIFHWAADMLLDAIAGLACRRRVARPARG